MNLLFRQSLALNSQSQFGICIRQCVNSILVNAICIVSSRKNFVLTSHSLARNVQRSIWHCTQDGLWTFRCVLLLLFSWIILFSRTFCVSLMIYHVKWPNVWEKWLQARQDGFKIGCFFTWPTNSMTKTSLWSIIKSWLMIWRIRYSLICNTLARVLNAPWLSDQSSSLWHQFTIFGTTSKRPQTFTRGFFWKAVIQLLLTFMLHCAITN